MEDWTGLLSHCRRRRKLVAGESQHPNALLIPFSEPFPSFLLATLVYFGVEHFHPFSSPLSDSQIEQSHPSCIPGSVWTQVFLLFSWSENSSSVLIVSASRRISPGELLLNASLISLFLFSHFPSPSVVTLSLIPFEQDTVLGESPNHISLPHPHTDFLYPARSVLSSGGPLQQ